MVSQVLGELSKQVWVSAQAGRIPVHGRDEAVISLRSIVNFVVLLVLPNAGFQMDGPPRLPWRHKCLHVVGANRRALSFDQISVASSRVRKRPSHCGTRARLGSSRHGGAFVVGPAL